MNPIPSLTSYQKLFLICKRGQSDLMDMPRGYRDRRSFKEVNQALVIIPGGGDRKPQMEEQMDCSPSESTHNLQRGPIPRNLYH